MSTNFYKATLLHHGSVIKKLVRQSLITVSTIINVIHATNDIVVKKSWWLKLFRKRIREKNWFVYRKYLLPDEKNMSKLSYLKSIAVLLIKPITELR